MKPNLASSLCGRLRTDIGGSTQAESIRAAVKHTRAALAEHSPIDAIGGICDGALIAALIAASDPSVYLYINLCGSPWEDLPLEMEEKGPVSIPSIHFLGTKDEILTLPRLMSLPQNAIQPVVFMHPQGHVVPILTDGLTRRTVQIIEDTMQQRKISPAQRVPQDTKTFHACADGASWRDESMLSPSKGDNDGVSSFDSMSLFSSIATDTASCIKAHVYFVSIVFVMLHHSRLKFLLINKLYPVGSSDVVQRNTLFQPLAAMSKLFGLDVFVIFAGQQDERITQEELKHHLIISFCVFYLSIWSPVSQIFSELIKHAHPSLGLQVDPQRLMTPQWYILASIGWKFVSFLVRLSPHGRKLLPALALAMHFGCASGACIFGREDILTELQWDGPFRVLAGLMIPTTISRIGNMWWLYATVPAILQQGFLASCLGDTSFQGRAEGTDCASAGRHARCF